MEHAPQEPPTWAFVAHALALFLFVLVVAPAALIARAVLQPAIKASRLGGRRSRATKSQTRPDAVQPERRAA